MKGLRKVVKRQWGAKHGSMPATDVLESQLIAKVSDWYTEHASAVCTPEQCYRILRMFYLAHRPQLVEYYRVRATAGIKAPRRCGEGQADYLGVV